MKGLDVRNITIDEKYSDGEDLGMSAIAYTSKPAIIIKGVAFSSHEQKHFNFKDDLKYRIAAPIMVPGEIYRKDGDEEYEVKFTVEVIEDIYKKFMSNLTGNPVFNIEHKQDKTVPSYILESILVDSENKIKFIKDEYGMELPLGSVFVVSQITDEKYYKYLVDNDMTGFSIEGFLGLEFSEHLNNKNKKQIEMEKQKFSLPDGSWETEDKIYVIKDGEVIEVKDKPMEIEIESSTDVKEEIKEEVKMEETEVKEEVKEEVKMEELPVEETPATPTIEPSMEETIVKVVDERIEVLINEIADLKSQLLELKNGGETEEVVMKKQEFSMSDKAMSLFQFVSNR